MRHRLLVFTTLTLASAIGFAVPLACRPDTPTCRPDTIEWQIRLALQASSRANPTDDGTALPTTVRIIQMRGSLAASDLTFEQVWTAEDAKALGEAFLSMEELTIYPDQPPNTQPLPVERDATHVLAAGLFREPVGKSWFTLYEIPKRHAELVCAEAPDTKIYPDPCFFIYLDANNLTGGPTSPPGFTPGVVECAALKTPPDPNANERRRRRDRRNRTLEDPLNPDLPSTPDLPQTPTLPDVPSAPQTPQAPSLPNAPTLPDAPSLPKPNLPTTPG